MGESSKGRGEPTPRSQDLMARFDMAKDNRERPPEVRAYLENLRPQILELQKRLKLQTDEDIAGLETRGDIDMGEVDKLVDLIKAFKTAWNENRISTSETRRIIEERLEKVGVPWRKFVECVDEYVTASATERDIAFSAIRAIARAGEPQLAWDLYTRIRPAWQALPIERPDDLLARLEIWVGFTRMGAAPPYNYWEFSKALKKYPISEFVRFEIVKALAQNGYPGEALTLMDPIGEAKLRLDALLLIRANGGPLSFIQPKLEEIVRSVPAAAVELSFENALYDEAMTVAKQHPDDHEVWNVVALWQGRLGNEEAVTDVIAYPSSRREQMECCGKAVAGLLEWGRVAPAKKFLDIWSTDVFRMDPADLAEIVVRLAAKGETELAESLSRNLHDAMLGSGTADALEKSERARARAIVRVINGFTELGMDTSGLRLALLYAPAHPELFDDLQEFSDLRIQSRTESSLRAFKRAAREFMATSPSSHGLWNQDEWERVADGILNTRPDIAVSLTYDKPLPA